MSIVTTSYQSSATIDDFVRRMYSAAEKLRVKFEIIIVDDGSTDDSKQKIGDLFSQYTGLKLIELSRNFGHHEAILTGLEHAQGEFIFLIDSDLEESPELLELFWEILQKTNTDVVFGVDTKNQRNWFSRLPRQIFWKIFKSFTQLQIPNGVCTVRLMKRDYLDALLMHKEVNVFLAGLLEKTGFRQFPVKIEKQDKGSTTYNFRRKFDLALTSIISFSGRPLRVIAVFGVFVVLVSLALLSYSILQYFFGSKTFQGWLSLVSLIVLFGGIQIMSIGLVAIYVASILEEVKSRPRSIVSAIKISGEYR
jgi:putative glycosyltransferase